MSLTQRLGKMGRFEIGSNVLTNHHLEAGSFNKFIPDQCGNMEKFGKCRDVLHDSLGCNFFL